MVKETRKTAARGRQKTPPLAWKENHIAQHRDAKGMTQQQMADALLERGIELGRNSVGRIEQGKQRPFHDTLEAMADILGIDVDSMVNLTPEEADLVSQFRSLSPSERRRALRHLEVARDD